MDLETLKTLTELKYQKSLTGFREVLAKEARLKGEIDRLRAQAHEARALPADKPAMQNIGADVIWLKWVGQTIRALNIELAYVLAQKETMMAQQRKAFGRKTVADQIAAQAKQDAGRRARDKALETAIAHTVLKPGK